MAQCAPDVKPTKVIQKSKADINDSRELSESTSAAGRVRPAELGLTRSLSKSDSDLLASPLGDEDGVLIGRSESMSNCSSGQQSTEHMPSFASEWDEVILELWEWETRGGWAGQREWHFLALEQEQAFKLSVLWS